jgi:hypothetical protein
MRVSLLPVGNAVRLFLEPPATAMRWKLLRKPVDTWTDQDDPTAAVIHDGDQRVILDHQALINGTTYYYKPFYFDGADWTASVSMSAVPAASYTDESLDVLSLVRDRIDDGLTVAVARGVLLPTSGHVDVLTAPPQTKETRWPVVTVQLTQDTPAERALGEYSGSPFLNADQGWIVDQGWLSRIQLTVIAWSLNPDERLTFGQVLKSIIIGNIPVFDENGMVNVEWQQSLVEDFESYDAPVYQVMGILACLAPSAISYVSETTSVNDVNEIDITLTA